LIDAGARLGAAALCLCFVSVSSHAGPWAQAGDSSLRSDIEILAAAGVIDNVTMQWPLPWAGLVDRLDTAGALNGQPDYVRAAAERVLVRGEAETRPDDLRASLMADATGSPNVIRGFDALGRESAQGQASVEYLWHTTALHIALGAQTVNRTDRQVFVPDDSYLAQRIGDAVVYAGYITHWWGPGWISALSLSNNARPVPQIGISRISTAPFESSWLSWLGPWQAEFFVGVLDGPRIARNTIYDGFWFGFSPLPGLEIGLSRTDEMCGTGHPCKPLVGYFNLNNQNNAADIVNDEGTVDLKYTGSAGNWSYSVYTQAMNEDTNPLVHSGTSHLFGGTVWTPLAAGVGRLTIEYTNSIATRDLWGGGTLHGVAYNNSGYPDGMRYRGRTLGFSLDSDSQLFSIQAAFTDPEARSFTLTYHHADVSDPLNREGNVVSTAPVAINQVQARVGLPLQLNDKALEVDVEARYQDDQPRPDKGALATLEARLQFHL
jgi:hypothetical protein